MKNPTKKGTAKGSAPPLRSRLPDEDDHQKRLDRARTEKDRQEIKRLREVLASARQKLLR